jgi:hypothetical protein
MFLLNNRDAEAGRGQPNQAKEKMSLEIFYEKIAEGLLANAVQKKFKLKVRQRGQLAG